jgi:hypothetical protein
MCRRVAATARCSVHHVLAGAMQCDMHTVAICIAKGSASVSVAVQCCCYVSNFNAVCTATVTY